jgi:hypothetical protein
MTLQPWMNRNTETSNAPSSSGCPWFPIVHHYSKMNILWNCDLCNFTSLPYYIGLETIIHLYPYQSIDGGFKAIERPEKGGHLNDIVNDFNNYQSVVNMDGNRLCRCFKKNYLKFWKWREYWTHQRWNMEYCGNCDLY